MGSERWSENLFAGNLVARAFLALFAVGFVRFLYRLYKVRTLFRDAQKHGISIMPHSFWFGHLAIVGRVTRKYPANLLSMILPQLLAQEYPDIASQGLLYIDCWPFAYPMIAAFHPDINAQFTQDVNLPKHPTMVTEFMPFTGCRDLLNMSGQEWKRWRAIFNPGFSPKNLTALIPSFLEEIEEFKDWLEAVAGTDEVVPLDTQACALATDVIGRATLGLRLDCQKVANPLFTALKDQIPLLIVDGSPPSLLKQIDPRRPFRLRRNNRIMRNYLTPLIESAAAAQGQDQNSSNGPKTIMSLAIKAYHNDTKLIEGITGVNPEFVEVAIAQFKIFILAGHDTTSAALCFAYHLLNKHPKALEIIRREHDEVFGKDPSQARDAIANSPQLLNQLPWTAAVIKEALRLYPPVSSVRSGSENFFLIHPDTGTRYPTKDLMLFSCHMPLHRNEQVWPRAHDFVPERWLAQEGEPLHVRKNAFRPFELGLRNCIGQELAMLEIKAVLAMTIREFDIQSVYSDDDPQWLGDHCYPTSEPGEFATGHPAKSMPVRVTKRPWTGANQ